jgi:hypothetical protein
VIGGIGIAPLAAGTVFGLVASGTYHRAIDQDCNGNPKACTQAGADHVGTARTQATVSTVLFIAGGAAVATGGILFLMAPKRRADHVQVSIAPVVGGSSLVASGTF